MESETSSIICRFLLKLAFVQKLDSIRPIRNPLNQNPVNLITLCSGAKTCPFHLSTYCFRCELTELIPEPTIVDKLCTRKNKSKLYLRQPERLLLNVSISRVEAWTRSPRIVMADCPSV